jgi:hypothetical protein
MLTITKLSDRAGLINYLVSGLTEAQRSGLHQVSYNPKVKLTELVKVDLVTAKLMHYNYIVEGYYLTLLGDAVLKGCDVINEDVAPDFKVVVANCGVLKPEKPSRERLKDGDKYGAFDI